MSTTVYTATRNDRFLREGYEEGPKREAQKTELEIIRHAYSDALRPGERGASMTIAIVGRIGRERFPGDDGDPSGSNIAIHLTPTQVDNLLKALAFYYPEGYAAHMAETVRAAGLRP